MANKYYQNPQERLPKETYEIYQNLSEEEKDKKRLEKDIKILLQKKQKMGITIIWNVSRSYLSILLKTKKQLLSH